MLISGSELLPIWGSGFSNLMIPPWMSANENQRYVLKKAFILCFLYPFWCFKVPKTGLKKRQPISKPW
jgi:hypothetical protein